VGAALRTQQGTIFTGVNVENASYGLSRCAEQSAVLAMVNAGEKVIREVLVIADADTAVSPCGACRQIIWEFGQDATVYMTNLQGDMLTLSIKELLPAGFLLKP
jgi:cytidine deaminase